MMAYENAGMLCERAKSKKATLHRFYYHNAKHRNGPPRSLSGEDDMRLWKGQLHPLNELLVRSVGRDFSRPRVSLTKDFQNQ